MISGFLLSKPFVAALLDDRPFTRTGPYAQRRFFRLFPAYWAALVITATVLDQVHLESLTDWIVHLTLLQAYSEGQFVRQLGVAWSLSVEVAFYAFLPLYFIALRALGGRAAPLRTMWLGNATLLVGGSAFVLWTDSWLQLNVIAWLPFEMPVFAVGIALAILHELRSRDRGPRRAIDVVARIAGWWWILAAAVLALAAVLWGETVFFRVAHRTGTQVLYTLFGLCMALPVVFPAARRSRLERVLNARVVAYVGLVSYGVYLWHLQLIDLIQGTWFPGGFVATNAFALFVVTAAFAVGVASVSWFVLERPALAFARRGRNAGVDQAPGPGTSS